MREKGLGGLVVGGMKGKNYLPAVSKILVHFLRESSPAAIMRLKEI